MATLPNPKTVSYRQWLRMPELPGEEVIDGVIHTTPPNKSVHARIVMRLAAMFLRQLDDAVYDVFSSSVGLVIRTEPLVCREPDLAIFERSRAVEIEGYFHSAPELAVEVNSPANTPRERKRKLAGYAELGIPEVWVFSPESRSVQVLLLENGAYRGSSDSAVAILTPKLLPSVRIEVAAVWPKPGA